MSHAHYTPPKRRRFGPLATQAVERAKKQRDDARAQVARLEADRLVVLSLLERTVEALVLILPMAKGYAQEHPEGPSAARLKRATNALAQSVSGGGEQ